MLNSWWIVSLYCIDINIFLSCSHCTLYGPTKTKKNLIFVYSPNIKSTLAANKRHLLYPIPVLHLKFMGLKSWLVEQRLSEVGFILCNIWVLILYISLCKIVKHSTKEQIDRWGLQVVPIKFGDILQSMPDSIPPQNLILSELGYAHTKILVYYWIMCSKHFL